MTAQAQTPVWLPPSVQRAEKEGGLPFLQVANSQAKGEVFLHGAQVTAWMPTRAAELNQPVLWTSAMSRYDEHTAIRGGIPLCFPWFGAHPTLLNAPNHGFARLSSWRLTSAVEQAAATILAFQLTDSMVAPELASAWPHAFEATITVSFGATLQLSLEVLNRGSTAFSYEAALHSYFSIADVDSTLIHGLEDQEFVDTVGGTRRIGRESTPPQLGEEIDRQYPTVTAARIEDVSNRREISISSQDAAGSVLWNPGHILAQKLTDFDDDGWLNMVCFENANIGDSQVTLKPGEGHVMSSTISVNVLNDSKVPSS